MIVFAGSLLVLIGIAHSVLGEKYILVRLFKESQLPKTLGTSDFTKQTLRFAWHLTTLAWWGFAAVLFAISKTNSVFYSLPLFCIGLTFFLSGVLSAGFTKGKHLSWIVFFVVAAISFWTGSTLGRQ